MTITTKEETMRGIALAVLVTTAALAIGCGDDDADGNQDAGASEAAMKGEKSDAAMKGDAAMSSEDGMKGDDAMKSDAAMSRSGKVVKVVDSDFGRVIADGKGEAFYLFDKEKSKRSRCFGECAAVWPPVLTKGRPRAGKGAKSRLLGTTRRPNGKLQVTYAGHPLYYYVDDAPGLILCHDVAEFGGLWLVVRPSGRAAA